MADGPPRRTVPLERQYRQIKDRFPDTILLFRLGDFYETFEDDAVTAADALDIVLTSREMGKGNRIPMAGIPHHAAEAYIARLIAAGHKVAVCEQIGDAATSKGLVERDVTRIVTPGTVTESTMLAPDRNNFIVAVVLADAAWGLAYADITTGEFMATQVAAASPAEALASLQRELLRLDPAEIVAAPDLLSDGALPSWLPERAACSPVGSGAWRLDRARETLQAHFRVEALDGFGLADKPLATRAAGGLLHYLTQTQMQGLAQVRTLSCYSTTTYMTLDAQTRRNLELETSTRGERRHSLLSVLDQTRTPMGARLLRRRINQPLLERDEIEQRLDDVTWFLDHAAARQDLRRQLAGLCDVERVANRALMGVVTPRELSNLGAFLAAVPTIRSAVAALPVTADLPDLERLRTLLQRALVDEPAAAVGRGEVIRPGFAAELDGHRGRAAEAREWIAALERRERERTGIRSLKVGYNRVFGYYVEITHAAVAAAERERAPDQHGTSPIPADYVPKQSLVNATRFITPQLKEYEAIVLTAEQVLEEMESAVYRRVVTDVASHADALLATAAIIAELDVAATLAQVAVERDYCRPQLEESLVLEIDDGRHPVLETVMAAGSYVPNAARLDAQSDQIIILTGPNMAGKSSWLRQVALITLMAQIGSYVPARRARIGLVDRIFTRIGAQDDIATGQSTFMVEMLETANILHHATPRSLVVLDEIGRGTSTYDGLAIARAVVEYIHNAPRLGCRTLFATHYHELTELEEILPRVRCYRMDVLEEGDRVVFLRQVVPGAADRSYGIHVAELAGIPKAIVRRASEVLTELEALRDGQRPRHPSPGGEDANLHGGPSIQLTLFAGPHPIVERLRELDIDSFTPIEAITLLYELQRSAIAADQPDA